jgi:hypothetical protein
MGTGGRAEWVPGEGEGPRVIRRQFVPSGGTQIVRGVWVLTAAAVLLAWLPVVRRSFVRIHRLCQEPNCNSGQLNSQAVSALHAIGLPVQAFAAWDDLLVLFSIAVFCAVGGLIIWRRQDRIGILAGFTLVLFGGITFPLGSPMEVLHNEGPVWGPPANILALAGSIGITLFIFMFPDGRFVPRWAVVFAVAGSVQDILSYLAPGSALDAQDGTSVNAILSILWLCGLVTMVGAQIYRYRAVSDPVERQQTKWVVLGIATALLSFLGLIMLSGFVPAVSRTGAIFLLFNSVFRLVMLPIPLGIGFAMLRYRLWDVDVLINRALVYGSLTLSTVGVYIGGVIGLQALFRAVTGQHSDLAIAIATLAVAALFNPWRHRVQHFIDRRFYRRRYDATRVLAAFSARLRDEVDLDQLSSDLLLATQETLQPRSLALWLPEGER